MAIARRSRKQGSITIRGALGGRQRF
ncbi:uncharacterized protein G2W53_026149 [Senna tora]|uniref:Uncharacterized protein n=1 Tax=Senna tora TaxID=362788 RepID=A0A834TNE3_9FABA|nr:uncharacterized protein G2W53_026149 [Senna tora]